MQLEGNTVTREEESIDFLELFNIIKGKLIWIAAFAMLGAVIAYAYSSFFITPLYSATSVVYVNNKKNTLYVESISASEIAASKRLVPTYQAIVCTKTAMRRAIEEHEIEGYTPAQLLSMVSTSSDEDTGVFRITVTGANQYDVAGIANAVAEIGSLEIAKYVEGATVNIIDHAVIPQNKSYPSNRKNTLIGFLAGMLLSAAAVVIYAMLDVRLKKSDDFSKAMGAPVLGVIPERKNDLQRTETKTQQGENKHE